MRLHIFSLLSVFSVILLITAFPLIAKSLPESGAQEVSSTGMSGSQEFAPGEILIKLKSPVSGAESSFGIMSAGESPVILSVDSAKALAKTDIGVESVEKLPLESTYRIKFSSQEEMDNILEEYRSNPNVEYAEPNYIYHLFATPNDAYFSQQWSLNITNATSAWDITTGNSSVIIAIIDTGVEYTHTDLAANIWNNSGETPGNEVDDDGNGYVDDVYGWNFNNNSNHTTDEYGHGTHVAGIAAAVSNNSLGVSGVCWKCRIMPVRVTNTSAQMLASDIASGISYAANMSAKIISISLGGANDSSAIRDAVNYAYNKSCIIVAAAGNVPDAPAGVKIYPAAYENVISVAATNNSDGKADYSQYGSWVDVAAPGGENLTGPINESNGILSTYIGNGYASGAGTSMAAPFVSGLAGLILSKNSTFTAEEVRTILRSTADPVNSSLYIGTGRVNMLGALSRNQTTIASLNSSLDDANVSGVISINGTANGTNFTNYSIYYGSGVYPSSWTQINYSNQSVNGSLLATWNTGTVVYGTYSLMLVVRDSLSQNSTDKLVLLISNNISSCQNLNQSNRTYYLSANVSSTGTCMNVTANNVTLDCQGHMINYSQSAAGYGINNTGGYNYTTIMNCTIVQGSAQINSFGIYMESSENSTAKYNAINTSGENSDGIRLFSSSKNNLSYNNISSSGISSQGILSSFSSNNSMSYNNIYTNGSSGVGIWATTSYDSEISFNKIAASGQDGDGIVLFGSTSRVNVSNNNITTNNSGSDGIWISASSNNTMILNKISAAGSLSYGIYLYNESCNNTISNSSITSLQSHGIYIHNSTTTIPENNTIYNCLLNGSILSVNFSEGFPANATNYWNISNRSGARTYSNGSGIGGNYYTNSTGNGFSDNCTDSDADGFCDQPYNVTNNINCSGSSCGNNTDYLALSNKYNYPPVLQNLSISCSDILNRTNGTLTGNFNFYDVDNMTTYMSNTTWFRWNGTNWSSIFNNSLTILAANTTKNETWVFSMNVSDGYAWHGAEWVNSTNITIINTPPSLALLTPSASQTVLNRSVNFTWNASDIDNDSINFTVWVNGTGFSNETNTSINSTQLNLSGGSYNWTVFANDSQNITQASGNFTVVNVAPAISYSISSPIVINSSNVTMSVNVTNTYVTGIWANVTWPNGTNETLSMANNTPVNFTNTSVNGTYSITFFANSTFGKLSNATGSFVSQPPVSPSVNVTAYNGANLSVNVTIRYGGSIIVNVSTSSTNGTINQQIPNSIYNITFETYSRAFNVTINSINASQLNRSIGFDNPTVSGYARAYAVNNSFNISTATVVLSYVGASGITNENYLGLYKCDTWNFSSRTCTGTWSNQTGSASTDQASDTFTLSVTNFSGFAIKQDPYCGNAVCDSTNSETCSNCAIDCGSCSSPGSGDSGMVGTTTTRTTTTAVATTTTIVRNATTTTAPMYTIINTSGNQTSQGGGNIEIDFFPLFVLIAIGALIGIAYLMRSRIVIGRSAEKILVNKSKFYRELMPIEKEAALLKRGGHDISRAESEIILAKRAISSEAFSSAKKHIENAKSIINAYKRRIW